MKTLSAGAHPALRKPGPGELGHRDGQQPGPEQCRPPAPWSWQRLQYPGREVTPEGGSAQPHPSGDGIRSLLPGTAVRTARQVRVNNLTWHAGVFTVQAGGDGRPDAVTIHASVVPARRPDSSRQSQELPGTRSPLS